MPLKDAPLCVICGKTRTKSPFGVCSKCKRTMGAPMIMCKRCGKKQTRNSNGLCRSCMLKLGKDLATPENIEIAIEKQKILVQALQLKDKGLNIREIAEQIGLSPNETYTILYNALYRNLAIDPRMKIYTKEHKNT